MRLFEIVNNNPTGQDIADDLSKNIIGDGSKIRLSGTQLQELLQRVMSRKYPKTKVNLLSDDGESSRLSTSSSPKASMIDPSIWKKNDFVIEMSGAAYVPPDQENSTHRDRAYIEVYIGVNDAFSGKYTGIITLFFSMVYSALDMAVNRALTNYPYKDNVDIHRMLIINDDRSTGIWDRIAQQLGAATED